MSPIDTTKWNGMENYSPVTRNLLKKIPLFELDDLMGMNPFNHSIKMYDPTGARGSVTTDGTSTKTSDVVMENSSTVESSHSDAKGPPQNIPAAHCKKKTASTPPPDMEIECKSHPVEFPKRISDLNFGAPPEFDLVKDY